MTANKKPRRFPVQVCDVCCRPISAARRKALPDTTVCASDVPLGGADPNDLTRAAILDEGDE